MLRLNAGMVKRDLGCAWQSYWTYLDEGGSSITCVASMQFLTDFVYPHVTQELPCSPTAIRK